MVIWKGSDMLTDLSKVRRDLQESGFFESDFYKVYDRAFWSFCRAHGHRVVTPEAASFALNEAFQYAQSGQSDFL